LGKDPKHSLTEVPALHHTSWENTHTDWFRSRWEQPQITSVPRGRQQPSPHHASCRTSPSTKQQAGHFLPPACFTWPCFISLIINMDYANQQQI